MNYLYTLKINKKIVSYKLDFQLLISILGKKGKFKKFFFIFNYKLRINSILIFQYGSWD